MPTLIWTGKEAVTAHGRRVPYHLLRERPELSVGEPGCGNLIVQGDNLLALKALLPYKGADRYDGLDATEKRTIGAVWEARSHGRCLFAMPNGKELAVIRQKIERPGPR